VFMRATGHLCDLRIRMRIAGSLGGEDTWKAWRMEGVMHAARRCRSMKNEERAGWTESCLQCHMMGHDKCYSIGVDRGGARSAARAKPVDKY
jgi:hypothetical protein